MKILYFIPGINTAGAEKQLLMLSENMIKRKYEVIVVTMMPQFELKPLFESLGISVTSLGMKSPSLHFKYIIRFSNIIKFTKPSIIHSHMMSANIFARITKLVNSGAFPKLICTSHNLIETENKIVEFLFKITDSVSDLNSIISKSAAKRYTGNKLSKNIKVVYNGVSLEKHSKNVNKSTPQKINNWSEKDFIWISVGRLEPQKGYLYLIKAFRLLLKKYTCNTKLIIAGDGSQRKILENMIRNYGISENVVLMGKCNDIPGLMSCADAFVLSSVYEGFGMVITEAMASSLPVIVTDSGGPLEIVGSDGSCGFVVEPESVEQLFQAMVKMHKLSKRERLIMGDKARQRVCTLFDMEKISLKWNEIYESFI
jgi:glycosyltransferase involved in cell wall biosynthesis